MYLNDLFQFSAIQNIVQMQIIKKDNLNNTLIVTEINIREKVSRKCELYRLTGHIRKHCPNATDNFSQSM